MWSKRCLTDPALCRTSTIRFHLYVTLVSILLLAPQFALDVRQLYYYNNNTSAVVVPHSPAAQLQVGMLPQAAPCVSATAAEGVGGVGGRAGGAAAASVSASVLPPPPAAPLPLVSFVRAGSLPLPVAASVTTTSHSGQERLSPPPRCDLDQKDARVTPLVSSAGGSTGNGISSTSPSASASESSSSSSGEEQSSYGVLLLVSVVAHYAQALSALGVLARLSVLALQVSNSGLSVSLVFRLVS
jgi:hypothetical protein